MELRGFFISWANSASNCPRVARVLVCRSSSEYLFFSLISLKVETMYSTSPPLPFMGETVTSYDHQSRTMVIHETFPGRCMAPKCLRTLLPPNLLPPPPRNLLKGWIQEDNPPCPILDHQPHTCVLQHGL